MTWTFLVVLAVICACAGAILAIRTRRRAVARVGRQLGPDASAAAVTGAFGLNPGELDDFRRAARENTQSQQERWNRDYPQAGNAGLPGHVAGIPRVLRVK